MKALKLYILQLIILVSLNASAQQGTLKGYLRDSITHYPISNGTIINGSTLKQAKTDATGFFYIEASSNDRIYIQAPEYHFDTLYYSPFLVDTLSIYLSPSGSILPGVTVRAAYTKYQLDSMERKKTFDDMRGTVAPTFGDHPPDGFGLTISLDRFFKKRYRQKAKAEERFNKTEEQLYIDYRFSPKMVAYYTGLKGDDLRLFMYRYTPSYKWLRQHTSQQDVLLYINDKLKLFRASQAAENNNNR